MQKETTMTIQAKNSGPGASDSSTGPKSKNHASATNTATNTTGQSRAIQELFAGFDKAYGQFEVQRTTSKGKAEGRAVTVTGPVTDALWTQHLTGSGAGLGVIPLTAGNLVHWACIDIDVVTINHAELEAKIQRLKLPLVVARSKSGGAHCFVFFTEGTPAPRYAQYWKAMRRRSVTVVAKCSPNRQVGPIRNGISATG